MLVSYTYRSDEPPMDENDAEAKSRSAIAKKEPETKTFSFYTVVDLGTIIPKEELQYEPPEL